MSSKIKPNISNKLLSFSISEPNEKLKIEGGKVSGPRRDEIEEIHKVNEYGYDSTVDGDCINNQIDLEECLIDQNRYRPCEPPANALSDKYTKLYEQRRQKFIKLLESSGYKITKQEEYFEPTWKIENIDEKYQSIVEEFLKYNQEAPEKKLPIAYESFLHHFNDLRAKISSELSNKFYNLDAKLNQASCQKEIDNPGKLFNDIDEEVDGIEETIQRAQEVLNTIKASTKSFIENFESTKFDSCDDETEIQRKIEQKSHFLGRMQWSCSV